MPIDKPVAELSNADLLVGVSLIANLLLSEIARTDASAPVRFAEKLDEVIQHLVGIQDLADAAIPLLLVRRTIEGSRPYEDVEKMVAFVQQSLGG